MYLLYSYVYSLYCLCIAVFTLVAGCRLEVSIVIVVLCVLLLDILCVFLLVVCIVVVVLCVLLSPYVYLLYYVCIAVFLL